MFRWEFLAKQIITETNFSFYPASDNFTKYFYTDSMPVLVHSTYLYAYLSSGSQNPLFTMLNVIFQLIAIGMIIFAIVHRDQDDANKAWIAVLFCMGSGVLVWGTAMNQDTGYTALSIAAILYFALAEKISCKSIIILAIVSSLGGLAREYGLAFILFTGLVLIVRKVSMKQLMVFITVSFVLTAPWYIRTWYLTQNPFYNINLFSIFPLNDVQAKLMGILADNVKYNSMGTVSRIIYGAGDKFVLLLILLVLALAKARKRDLLIYLAVLMMSALWFISLFSTYMTDYSLRVLTPLCPLIIVLFFRQSHNEKFIKFLVPIAACLALYNAFIFPQNIEVLTRPGFSQSFKKFERRSQFQALFQWKKELTILTENPFIFSESQEYANINVVPVWDPRLKSLFLGDVDKPIHKLEECGINAIMLFKDSYFNVIYNKGIFLEMRNWEIILETDRWVLYGLPD